MCDNWWICQYAGILVQCAYWWTPAKNTLYIHVCVYTHTHTHIHTYIISSTPIPSFVDVRLRYVTFQDPSSKSVSNWTSSPKIIFKYFLVISFAGTLWWELLHFLLKRLEDHAVWLEWRSFILGANSRNREKREINVCYMAVAMLFPTARLAYTHMT